MSEPTHDEADQQRLNETMRTLVELLVGRQIDAMREKIEAVEGNLEQRLRQFEENAETRASQLLDQFADRLGKAESRLKATETIQDEQNQRAGASEAMLRGELEEVCRGLSSLQTELQEQMVATERISGLLDNLAGVFSAKAKDASAIDAEPLDDEIDRVFEVRVGSDESNG